MLLASVAFVIWLADMTAAVVSNFIAPQLMDVRTGSPAAVTAIVVFVVSGVSAWVAFHFLFRQANREGSLGYTTLTWNSLRGSVPRVNPYTRRIERLGPPRFDADAARARTPWSSHGEAHPSNIAPETPSFGRIERRVRWFGIAATALMAVAIVARVQGGGVSASTTLFLGPIVLALLFAAVVATVIIIVFVQATRLARVSRVASGIILSAFSTLDTRAATERLNLAAGTIPWLAVLVFDEDGFSIWRGSREPRPVWNVSRSDVIGLDTTLIVNGRTSNTGLEVAVIPPDERWPLLLDFTISDPSRRFAATNERKLNAITESICALWIGRGA
ncbi:hypothetical protein [Leifsonia shinshuensis]|uniref:Uncharacterized protein n=1 Tax=Leifsonia shinshuensis TaxID=150026 RepID=A0A853CVX2_9MICO|nr:hypothetical protein [Leifsonia shinshuensis]NYJ24429.1 hypothetical protein [Leifsonia shinshuensis]